MTREQKKDWLANASNEQVIEQFRSTVCQQNSDDLHTVIEANNDYILVYAELMKRLSK